MSGESAGIARPDAGGRVDLGKRSEVGGDHAGRTRVMPRALRAVATAVTADALAVRPGAVKIDLVDDRGMLRVNAASPIGVDPHSATGASAPVLERAEQAQHTVRERLTELTGARVSAVDLTITDAVLKRERRVR